MVVVNASDGYFPYLFDEEFTQYDPTYSIWNCPKRASLSRPSGKWYANGNFDCDWYCYNYANIISTPGIGCLFASSTDDFILKGKRGWSNSFLHQGRPVYAGGIYEGKFKAGQSLADATEVDGIRYEYGTSEPTNTHFLRAKVNISERYLDAANSFASVLVGALFQYVWPDESLSLYDSPPQTNYVQSLHFDAFLSRTYKILGFYGEDNPGATFNTWGDAYNNDLHVQYVAGKISTLGQYQEIVADWGMLMNHLKYTSSTVFAEHGLPSPKAIILRYLQLSAETVGGRIAVTADYVKFRNTADG